MSISDGSTALASFFRLSGPETWSSINESASRKLKDHHFEGSFAVVRRLRATDYIRPDC
jgi:hypothetical protein